MKRNLGRAGEVENTEEKSSGKMDVSEGIEYKPLCQEDIARVTSANGALSRKFHAYDLVPQKRRNLQVRGYMDYYGGYAEHARQIVYGLHDTGRYNVGVVNIKTPVDVDPLVWQKNNWFIHNRLDVANSDFMVIAGPGWLQKKFLPEARRVIGWTMIESLNYSAECSEWLQNADWLLCPTDTDLRRARDSRAKNAIKAHLGYDDALYHANVKPMEIVGLEGRFVFGVLGSWNIRKGVAEIIRAYCHAFTNKDPVTLLMVCKYGNRKWGDKKGEDIWKIDHEFEQIAKSIGIPRERMPHISLVDVPVHETVLPTLMARFDALVGFSSGESTWLPGLQAMAMGIPVIQLQNDCCGYMEYMNDDNSYLCKNIEYRVCSEEFWRTTSEYYQGQVFGYGDFEELAAMMARVRKDVGNGREPRELVFGPNKNEYLDRVRRAKHEMKAWTWGHSVSALCEILDGMD